MSTLAHQFESLCGTNIMLQRSNLDVLQCSKRVLRRSILVPGGVALPRLGGS